MVCKEFYEAFIAHGLAFFAGVPDSLLKDICAYITDHADSSHHIITANEGGAVALVSGYYLATGKIGVVYLQNSGEGNMVNPLASLADPEVYSIPMLLIIGWRGEPGVHDEPQHVKQGKITLDLLTVLGIPFTIVSKDSDITAMLCEATQYMKEKQAPFALVIKKGVFDPYVLQKKAVAPVLELTREDVIKIIARKLDSHDVVITTTGMTSRELFEYREANDKNHSRDFLTVGSMGHASQIALGIAVAQPQRTVYCIDGDGAVIMHAGALAIIGNQAPKNFKHIIINNGAHDSVGGQPTAGFFVDFLAVAKACGYRAVVRAQTREELEEQYVTLKNVDGPAVLEVRVKKGARKDLGRPTTTPQENKEALMVFLKEDTL